MKKTFSLLLVLSLMLALFAGCVDANNPETTVDANVNVSEETTTEPVTEEQTEATPVIENAEKLLNAIWSDIPEEEQFYVGGGDYDTMTENVAGTVTNNDYKTAALHMPEEMLDQADDVASLVHGMNANNMTIAAYHLASSVDTAAFASGMRDAIQSTHWMCGFPELLYIASVGEYVIVGFGLTENINAIATHTEALYPTVEVLYNELIDG